ncbi:hypothetical protein NLU13_5332 [Sarocladium strictum]|uniref:Uncharacterized protein n=1 Tax=Sarocladium strictum TaxID=5046 RepID=A0AA39L7I6_SARSR|nr:hypothetical protein NLU13_5332 [Sarocladium strictum]
MADLKEAQMPFIKNLASSDRVLRTASLESLQTFLSSRRTLPQTDALKLWKGLFYALWMTDRPLPQQRLTSDLASLLHTAIRPACAPNWLAAFWAVMGLQWSEIDNLRMQKYLLLVRRVFNAQIAWCKERGYEGEEVDKVEEMMKEWCFEEEGTDLKRVPVGLRLHVLDIWVDELEREGALEDEQAEGFVKRMGTMVELLKRSPIKTVRERAEESFEDERLPWGKKADADEEEGEATNGQDDSDGEGWGGFDD